MPSSEPPLRSFRLTTAVHREERGAPLVDPPSPAGHFEPRATRTQQTRGHDRVRRKREAHAERGAPGVLRRQAGLYVADAVLLAGVEGQAGMRAAAAESPRFL